MHAAHGTTEDEVQQPTPGRVVERIHIREFPDNYLLDLPDDADIDQAVKEHLRENMFYDFAYDIQGALPIFFDEMPTNIVIDEQGRELYIDNLIGWTDQRFSRPHINAAFERF